MKGEQGELQACKGEQGELQVYKGEREKGESAIFDQNSEQYERGIADPQAWKENIGHWSFTKVKGEQGGIESTKRWKVKGEVIL